MSIDGLIFNFPRKQSERELLTERLRETSGGSEAFTHLVSEGENAATQFLCGRNSKGEILRFIFSFGGAVYLFSGGKFPSVYTNASISYFGGITGDRLRIMNFAGENPCDDNGVKELTGTDIIKTFELITDGKMTRGDERRYVYRVRAVSRSLASVYGIFDENGELLSTASIIAENEKYALIGDVFTRPDVRNRGLARRVCLAACRSALQKGKTPQLLCLPEMSAFYNGFGFVDTRA